MALFPQFPYSNLHELNLDWIIEQIRQVTGEGVVLSVNGLSGVVTLYTENNIELPDCHYDTEWSVARLIDEKIAGLKFNGEKFFYITKNHDAEEFTVQEVYTSGNQPPYPVTSVNGHDGAVVLAGDNLPYVIDGSYTIEDIVEAIQGAIGAVILGKKCDQAVSAGQYVFLIMSNITGRADGLYKAVNNVSANTDWTASDLSPVAGGLGALMASNDSAISSLDNKITPLAGEYPLTLNDEFVTSDTAILSLPNGAYKVSVGASNPYFPQRYGTLIVAKSRIDGTSAYAGVIFLASTMRAFVRHGNLSGGTWVWHTAYANGWGELAFVTP